MSAAEEYRRNASECVAITAFFVDPRQRATILALAEAWDRLADQAEKNARLSAGSLADLSSPPEEGEER